MYPSYTTKPADWKGRKKSGFGDFFYGRQGNPVKKLDFGNTLLYYAGEC